MTLVHSEPLILHTSLRVLHVLHLLCNSMYLYLFTCSLLRSVGGNLPSQLSLLAFTWNLDLAKMHGLSYYLRALFASSLAFPCC